MGKIMLTEKSEPLKYIKESGVNSEGKHYLGKLAGPASDWTRPTRNGRRYPYELWVNVQNSPDFKEGMETLTIFGEADHPEDRIDTSIKEIAIVMTKYEIRQNEGYVYAEFDILDTPNGRILKELLDYGSKIGVSSRGLGDEIERDGEMIIDPDTYLFYAYDAVVMPAVATARPAVIESVESKKSEKSLLETFNREIENATSVADLKSIEKLAETVNIPSLDSVKESIKNKISSYNEGENISSLKSDLATSLKENEELKAKISKLESTLTAKNIRLNTVKSRLSKVTESSSNLRKLLMKASKDSKAKDEAILEGVTQIDELTDCLEGIKISYEKKIRVIKESNRRSINEYKSTINSLNRKLSSIKEGYNDKILELKEHHAKELAKSEKESSTLRSSVSELKKQLESAKSSKILSEKNSNRTKTVLENTLKEAKKSNKLVTDKYLEMKCRESGLDPQTVKYNLPKNYTVKNIDEIVSKLADRKLRMSKIPFEIQSNLSTVTEVRSSKSSRTEEEIQTIQFLEANKKF